VRFDHLAAGPARHPRPGRGPERRSGQPVRAAGQPPAGFAREPRAAARVLAGSRAARLVAPVAKGLAPGTGGRTWPPVAACRALVLALAFAGAGVAGAQEAGQPVGAVDQLPPEQEVSDTVIELAG